MTEQACEAVERLDLEPEPRSVGLGRGKSLRAGPPGRYAQMSHHPSSEGGDVVEVVIAEVGDPNSVEGVRFRLVRITDDLDLDHLVVVEGLDRLGRAVEPEVLGPGAMLGPVRDMGGGLAVVVSGEASPLGGVDHELPLTAPGPLPGSSAVEFGTSRWIEVGNHGAVTLVPASERQLCRAEARTSPY